MRGLSWEDGTLLLTTSDARRKGGWHRAVAVRVRGRSEGSSIGTRAEIAAFTHDVLRRRLMRRKVNIHVVPPLVKHWCDCQGQSGTSGDRRPVLVVQTSGVLAHEAQKCLGLDRVKGTGNGLESRWDSSATIGVFRNGRFNELANRGSWEAAGLQDYWSDTV